MININNTACIQLQLIQTQNIYHIYNISMCVCVETAQHVYVVHVLSLFLDSVFAPEPNFFNSHTWQRMSIHDFAFGTKKQLLESGLATLVDGCFPNPIKVSSTPENKRMSLEQGPVKRNFIFEPSNFHGIFGSFQRDKCLSSLICTTRVFGGPQAGF